MTSHIKIPAPLQATLDNLAYLAAVQNNEKFFFSERTYIKAGEWSMVRMRRYWKGETLTHQIPIIRNIIDCALDCFKTYKSDCHFPRLLSLFNKAKDGISNIRNTYTLEGANVVDVETIIYLMNTQLEHVNFQPRSDDSD